MIAPGSTRSALLVAGLIGMQAMGPGHFPARGDQSGQGRSDGGPPPVPKRIAEARSIKLGAESVTVKLNPLDAGEEGPRSLPARVARLEPGRKIHLVVEDLRMQAPPGVLFDLYLDLPRGATAEQKTRHKVGVINFFNASGEEPGKEPGEEKPGAGEPRFISFDITDILKKMHAQGALKEESTLTIVPVGKVAADSRPSIGRLSLTSS